MFNTAAFLTYVAVMAFTPGPNTIMSMGNASRLGLRRGYPFNLGILTGTLVVGTLCTLFSSLLYALLPRVELWMKIVGAAYMLYLAWKTLASKAALEAGDARSGYVSGLLLQFVNPKLYLYCITAMSSYILPYFSGFWPLAGFVCLLAFAGLLATTSWAAFGSVFRRLFEGHRQVVNVVMALLLVYCAVSLFL